MWAFDLFGNLLLAKKCILLLLLTNKHYNVLVYSISSSSLISVRLTKTYISGLVDSWSYHIVISNIRKAGFHSQITVSNSCLSNSVWSLLTLHPYVLCIMNPSWSWRCVTDMGCKNKNLLFRSVMVCEMWRFVSYFSKPLCEHGNNFPKSGDFSSRLWPKSEKWMVQVSLLHLRRADNAVQFLKSMPYTNIILICRWSLEFVAHILHTKKSFIIAPTKYEMGRQARC